MTQTCRSNRQRPAHVSSVLSAALLMSVVAASAQTADAQPSPKAERPAAAASARTATVQSLSLAPVLDKVIPAVVSIRVIGARNRPVVISGSSAADTMATTEPTSEPFRSGGSGVVIDAARGLVLTNHHVIADAVTIDVALSDGRVLTGKLIGADIGTDVAVVQVPAQNLTPVKLGSSRTVRVGDVVLAVGNPFGLEGTATRGIVSALQRTDVGYEIFENFIQIDAPVNPGNSGGALVDADGALVGINTAVGGSKMRAQGIGFAIPIDMARAIADELVKAGTFRRGVLGIVAEDVSQMMATAKNIGVVRGAAISSIVPSSPAAAAGLKPGDVIVAADEVPVRGHVDYVAKVMTVPVGGKITLSVLSAGATSPRPVPLVVSGMVAEPSPELPPKALRQLSGLALGVLSPGFAEFGKIRGARVLDVGTGDIAKSGLKRDDVITNVDMTTVRAPDDVYEAIGTKMGRYRLEIVRGGRTAWIYLDGQ